MANCVVIACLALKLTNILQVLKGRLKKQEEELERENVNETTAIENIRRCATNSKDINASLIKLGDKLKKEERVRKRGFEDHEEVVVWNLRLFPALIITSKVIFKMLLLASFFSGMGAFFIYAVAWFLRG